MGYNQRREFKHIITEIIDLMIVAASFYVAVHIFNFIFNKELTYREMQGIIPIVVIVSLLFFEIFGVFYDEQNTYLDSILNITLANFMSIMQQSL